MQHMSGTAVAAALLLLLSACVAEGRPAAADVNAYATRQDGGDAGGINTWKDLLAYKNQYRARHGAPPLKWDSKLYGSAEAWAKRCQFQHSQGGYGENLAWNFGNWKQVVDAWYNEEKMYNYNSPGWDSKIGHFTQIVWKDTKTVACAYACQIYVCQYWPAGNVLGYFDKNVGQKKW